MPYEKKYLSGNPVTDMKRRERGVFTQKGESLLLFCKGGRLIREREKGSGSKMTHTTFQRH